MSKYRFSDNLVITETDGEAVILDIDSGKYFGLDEMGLIIWRLLEKNYGIEEVGDYLTKHFDVDREVAIKDVSEFITKIKEKGLLL